MSVWVFATRIFVILLCARGCGLPALGPLVLLGLGPLVLLGLGPAGSSSFLMVSLGLFPGMLVVSVARVGLLECLV